MYVQQQETKTTKVKEGVNSNSEMKKMYIGSSLRGFKKNI